MTKDYTNEDGMACRIVLTDSGWHCGYVGVPPGHPAFGVGYEIAPVEGIGVHGGVTFADHWGDEDPLWWIGFDCMHYDDGMQKGLPGWKDEDYVRREIDRMSTQLKAMKE
jgi:hypothetical protein